MQHAAKDPIIQTFFRWYAGSFCAIPGNHIQGINIRLLSQAIAALAVAVGLMIAGTASAQTTETKAAVESSTAIEPGDSRLETEQTTDTADAQSIPEAKLQQEELSIALLGEVVGANESSPAKGPFPDLASLTTGTLGGEVTDLTTPGLTMEQLVQQAKSTSLGTPDVTIIFTGFTDGENRTADETQRLGLKQTVAALRGLNKNMKIFLIPASTSVGAITSANLRLTASETDAIFVPIGTEVGGQPYQDALEAVRAELTTPNNEGVSTAQSQTEAATSVIVRGDQVTAPSSQSDATGPDFEAQKADLQKELDRIAGQAGDASLTLPSLEDAATTSFAGHSATGTTTVPEGGTLTRRGVEARDESIQMKPLPAVKAFRPQIPVPRNEVDVKEPALSR